MICSTIRDIIVQAEKRFQGEDAIRYKVGKILLKQNPIHS